MAKTTSLKEGDVAPAFDLPASGSARNITLKSFKGKKNVVLYFYPKDDTQGCTTEACNFRDNIKNIEKFDTIVLGISPDGIAKHEKFTNKYKLPFPLLSDEDKKVCEAYGVWVEKNMYGRKYMGVARSTFIIGKDGKLKKIFPKVKPKEHAAEVLEFLKTL
ncbi:MAG: thioredoxin-dependent thiol peroxidase [Candidatus Omnitrophica bacterium]|nr:thioredoxin-dependent thiol peroxidase [Candidatus Omnitrophota bacterium]